MHDLLIDGVGVAAGLGTYAIVRGLAVLHRRRHTDGRDRRNRRDRLDGLLAPYGRMTAVPIPVRDELPANVYQLRRR